MADNNLNEELDGIFNDILEDSTSNAATSSQQVDLQDQNSDLFKMLGMEDEEINKARKALEDDDTKFKKQLEKENDSTLSNKNSIQSDIKSIHDLPIDEEFKKPAYEEKASTNEDVSDLESTKTTTIETEPEEESIEPIQEGTADSDEEPEAVLDALFGDVNNEIKESQKEQAAEESINDLDLNADIPPIDTELIGDVVPIEELVKQELAKDDSKLAKAQAKLEAKARKKAAKEAKRAAKLAAKSKKQVVPSSSTSEDEGEDYDLSLDMLAGEDSNESQAAKPADLTSEQPPKESFFSRLALTLFGPEDPPPTEEELAAEKEAQEELARKKEEKAQAKVLKKAENEKKKAAQKEMATVKKAASKAQKERDAELQAEEDAKEKKVSKKSVVAIILILAILGGVVVFGTNQFSYHSMVNKAANYFEMQKYRLAYEQIVGVDVKDRDQKIKDKIYCVMYTQRQLDAYNNFDKLHMYENALDALLKGVKKFDAHYSEAEKLGIKKDFEYLQKNLSDHLKSTFGLTLEQARGMTKLDQNTYATRINQVVSKLNIQPTTKAEQQQQQH